jgi:hypothetical protein
MAEGGLLHAAADLADHGVGEPDGMNVIYDCGVNRPRAHGRPLTNQPREWA